MLTIVLQSPPDVSTNGEGGPEVKKFEQVSRDIYQMSLDGGGKMRGISVQLGPTCRGGPRAGAGGTLYSELQCIMVLVAWDPL